MPSVPPGYAKTIVCLADSAKNSLRCIAGIELCDGHRLGWIRPVSAHGGGELNGDDRRYEGGKEPRLLDLIRIHFRDPQPSGYQVENHLIDDTYYWEPVGTYDRAAIRDLCDDVQALWVNGYSSYNGINDQVPEASASSVKSSLALIQPANITLEVVDEQPSGTTWRRLRASFRLNGVSYRLIVTDPWIRQQFFPRGLGSYSLGADACLCISLGKVCAGYGYKLVAGVVPR
jgi:hypothetical protein